MTKNAKHAATPMMLNEKLKQPEDDNYDTRVPYELIDTHTYVMVHMYV